MRAITVAMACMASTFGLLPTAAATPPAPSPSASVVESSPSPVSAPISADSAPTGPASSAEPNVAPAGTPLPTASPDGAIVVDGTAGSRTTTLLGAYARRNGNACSWTVGSPGISKTFTFAKGTYTMTSFRNELVRPAQEYVTPEAPALEFRFGWDGHVLTGGSGGWVCRSGSVRTVDSGGAPALRLQVTLERRTVQVTKHYTIFPKVAMVRQWTSYANIDTHAHQLTKPSYLEQNVMGDTMAETDLTTIGGSWSWEPQTDQMTADYARTISASPDDYFLATSTNYQPWFALFNREREDGIYAGFDYFGRWSATFGLRDGVGSSLSMFLPNYDAPLAAGTHIDSPRAFDAVYRHDLDDMTNRILTWQYTYMWDYTRAPYFGAVRDEGPNYLTGSPRGDLGADSDGQLQWMLNLTDAMSSMGVDTYHRDHGWFDKTGDFKGLDFRIVNNYLKKHGMAQLIYYFAYDADPDSKIALEHPDWFDQTSNCGQGLIDLRIPQAKAWLLHKLVSNAKRWGDYEWRNDNCSMANWTGDRQLAQDQAFRSVLRTFLDTRPGSGFHAVNWGGNQHGFDYLRYADGTSMTDSSGYSHQYGGSMIYPVDKLSPPPENYPISECDDAYTFELMWSPDLQGDTADPQRLACARRMIDLYHYILSQGVAGRWTRQYHPRGSDDNRHWFERLSWDNERGVIIFKGSEYKAPPTDAPVTVYPKGLRPNDIYDVRFQYEDGVFHRLGSDLMENGITLPAPAAGELVWLNLPNHPGSGTNHIAPTAPRSITATVGTNFTEPGVEVRWTRATDDNWISGYQVLRDGVVLDTVAKGTYYLDHTPAASTASTYSVRTIDGDGNTSRLTSTAGGTTNSTYVDDDSPNLQYSGRWAHQSQVIGPFAGTQSVTSGLPCHIACQQFSDQQGSGGWSYQQKSPPMCLMSCQQFSDTQGQDGWSYQGDHAGQWEDLNFYFSFFGWVGTATTADGGPDLSEFYGAVSATGLIPGAGHDTARAWTAAKDGIVTITSEAAPRDDQTYVLTVTKNGQAIAGPISVSGQGTPTDINIPDVAVTAGDVIRFQIDGVDQLSLQGGVDWQANMDYAGEPPAAGIPPRFVDLPTFDGSGDFFGDGSSWTSDDGTISASQLRAGSLDVARAWTAPENGTYDVLSHASMNGADTSGQGATLEVTLNNAVIWGPQSLDAGDRAGIDVNVPAVQVSAGDVIRFVVGSNSGVVVWDPDIVPTGTEPPAPQQASVSWSFTGNEVTWFTQVGTNRGVAQILIDGQPDARINLYSSNDTNWSIPLYTKTFTTSGQHTITIEATGDSHIRALGSGVQVDGFRARTRSVSVTEDGSTNITYRGLGWQRTTDASASAGHLRLSGHAGDTATMTFQGAFVGLTGRICPACGEADVYLDGKYVTRIDSYGFRGPTVAQAGLFEQSWPVGGRHTLRIVVTGTKNIRSTGTSVGIDNIRIGS